MPYMWSVIGFTKFRPFQLPLSQGSHAPLSSSSSFITPARQHITYTQLKKHTHANIQHKILQLKSTYTKKHTLKYTL